MKNIELDIKCQSCKGTGVYIGMAERDGAGVVCYTCKGTGCQKYKFQYEDFNGIVRRDDVKRVYKKSYGYVLAPKEIDFEKVGKIDLSVKGVSYQEFLTGKMPEHIREFGCPMWIDQGSCHDLKGFTDRCKCFGRIINHCDDYDKRVECWKDFDRLTADLEG